MSPDTGQRDANDLSTLSSLASTTAIVVALSIGREVLIPIALAIVLSFILAPVVRLLRRVWIPRVPAVFLAVLLTLAMILSLAGLIGTQVSALVFDIPRYASTIDEKIVSVRARIALQVSGIVAVFETHPPPEIRAPAPVPTARAGKTVTAPAVPAEPPKPAVVELHAPDPTPIEIAERIITPVMGPLATVAIMFAVSIFILLQQADLRDRFIRLFGLTDLHRTTRALDDAGRRLSRYLLTLLGLNALFGVIVGVGLLFIGVPNPLLWGTLGMLFRFVPYIGSVLAGLLPAVLAAAVDPGWGMAIETVSLFAVVEIVMGQFIDPLAYGRSTGLSPVAVVVAAIFWSWMWGAVGLILSMPLTLCLVVLGRHVKRLEFLDVLMGNRPALTGVESFYQRMLAGDADQALEHAETMLKDRSLSGYYDEVAIKGLQHVAQDAERGMVGSELMTRIRESMVELVRELDSFHDVVPATARPLAEVTAGMDSQLDPAVSSSAESVPIDPGVESLTGAWVGTAPVMCITGSGPLDGAVTDMLVQLLAKNGLGAITVPNTVAQRNTIASLDLFSTGIVCITCLDASLSPSELRYMVRRVRGRAPNVPILVGLWPGEDATMATARLIAVAAADYNAVTLRDTVNICLELARAATMGEPAQV